MIDTIHVMNIAIFATVPIDFKLLISILSPKINSTKNGIPTANKVSNETNQIGVLVVFTILA